MSRAVDRLHADRDAAERKLTESLEELGALSADGIRDRLVADGIRGSRRACAECPIALWLQARTGLDVGVGPEEAVAEGRIVRLPDSVASFIASFDDGDMYQELVRS